MANNSDIIKIGFDYRSSLEAFEKETNGVFDGISEKAGKQKIVIQLDAKNDKIIEKIKELQKLKLDKFTFEFGDSGIKEQLKTFDQLQNKINEIINLSKGISGKTIGNGIGNSIVDEKSLNTVIDLFTKMESHLGTIKKVFSDVGDGSEFSPLLSTIEKINTSISELSTNIKSISLNMNIDVGSNKELETKYEEKIAKALGAYQKLFEHIKSSSAGGSVINQKFFDFDINQFDTMMGKLTGYQKFIKDMRDEAKAQFNGKDVLRNDTDPKYWNQLSAALAQVTKVENEMKESASKNPLTEIFGKTDLSEVISQLDKIVTKLEEISTTASEFKTIFANGFNVTTSVDEIDKLTNRVKELENELSKVKLNPANLDTDKSNISSATNSSSTSFDEEKAKLKEIGESAEETKKKLGDVVFKPNTEGFDEIVNKLQIAKDKIDEISKITKSSVWSDSQGKYLESYNIRYKNGSSEIRGESSNKNGSNVLNANEVAYDSKVAEQEAKAIQKKWEDNVKAIQKYMDAVTELNNLKAQDKETGKRAEEISDQVKKVGELKEVAEKARIALSSMVNPHDTPIDTWNKWLSVMEQFEQASNGSTKSVAKLKDALRNMNQSKIDSVSSDINSFQNKADDYEKRKNQSIEYTNQVEKLKTAISELRTEQAKLSADEGISEEQQKRIDSLTNSCKDYISALQHMSAAEKGSSESSRMKQYDKIAEYMKKNTRMSKEFREELEALQRLLMSGDASVNVENINTQFIKIKDRIRAAKQEGQSFIDIFKTKVVYGFAGQLAMYYLSFYDFIRYARNAVNVIIELDTALIDLTKTTAMSNSQLEGFYYSSNNIAKQMGVTTQEIIDQASAWSRLGYNTQEAATQMAQLSSQFASISPGMETDQAQEGLVSIMKAWDIDVSNVKTEIMDNINILGNSFAETNADIVEGMKRSAAALSAVGTDYKDAFALFTGTQEILQNAEVAGRALRSISLRVRGYSEESEDGFEELDEELSNVTGELIDLTKTAEHAQGVSIFKEGSTTEFKSLVDYFGEINAIWDEMTEKQQNDYLQTAFGKTQAQSGAALIKNFDAVRGSLEKMEQSAGSADKEMETIRQSLTFKINNLKETWVGTAQSILDRGDFGKVIDSLTKLSEAIGFVIDKAGLLGTIGIGAGLFASVKNIGREKCYPLIRICL